jgi:hypothetical protein
MAGDPPLPLWLASSGCWPLPVPLLEQPPQAAIKAARVNRLIFFMRHLLAQ